MTANLKPCPFCGSTKLDISVKRVQTNEYTNYRTCVYCKNCNSYGPRVVRNTKLVGTMKDRGE